jgi:geranylgeranyl pyrophosphate synthase
VDRRDHPASTSALRAVDEPTYFQIVRGKTASLFEWALRAGAREGGAGKAAIDALGRFGGNLGIAFQLVDADVARGLAARVS